MRLKLKIQSYAGKQVPRSAENECYFDAQGGSIGRGQGNTWILSYDAHLSRRHVVIEQRNGMYYISDMSSNGVFINQSNTPIGRNNSRIVNDGDIIQIGEHKILAEMVDNSMGDSTPRRFEEMPVAPPSLFSDPAISQGHVFSDIGLTPSSRGDESSSDDPFGDVFNPRPKHQASAVHQENEQFNSIHDAFKFDAGYPPQKVDESNPKIFDPPFQQPPTYEDRKVNAITHTNTSPQEFLRYLLEGAGLNPDRLKQELPKEVYYIIGRVILESVQGTMELLRGRTEIKNHLRLDRTVIGDIQNNPLKFMPNAEQVMIYFFTSENDADKTYLPLPDAIQEAFDDLKAHQFAVTAAMQQALLTTVRHHFSPENLKMKLEKTNKLSSKIPFQREAKLWDMFESLYNDIEHEASENFQAILDREVAKTYAAHVKEIKHQRGTSRKKEN